MQLAGGCTLLHTQHTYPRATAGKKAGADGENGRADPVPATRTHAPKARRKRARTARRAGRERAGGGTEAAFEGVLGVDGDAGQTRTTGPEVEGADL